MTSTATLTNAIMIGMNGAEGNKPATVLLSVNDSLASLTPAEALASADQLQVYANTVAASNGNSVSGGRITAGTKKKKRAPWGSKSRNGKPVTGKSATTASSAKK